MVASLSTINLGVLMSNLPQVIFSFGTAPLYEPNEVVESDIWQKHSICELEAEPTQMRGAVSHLWVSKFSSYLRKEQATQRSQKKSELTPETKTQLMVTHKA